MPLPNPGQDAVPFTTLTAQFYDETIENIESLADGSGMDNDSIPASAINFGGAGSGIWWEEIGRTTLGVAGDTITVSSLPTRRYLKIMVSVQDTGGTVNGRLRFNNDSGSNYASRYSVSGAADTTEVSQTSLLHHAATFASVHLAEICVYNIATDEKTSIFFASESGTAGAGSMGSRVEGSGKWSNTADQITRIDILNTGSGDFAIGSEVVVLGHD